MTLPVINAIINFSTGPSFAQAMILGEGILGTNILSDSAAVIVDVSDVVDTIQTNRGRNPQAKRPCLKTFGPKKPTFAKAAASI